MHNPIPKLAAKCIFLHTVLPGVPFTKAPCDFHATFERPEKWAGRSVVAQTQKVLFLCNCYRTTRVPSLNHQNCHSGTKSRTKEAEWRQIHCHGGSRVAVVAEWRLSGRHSDRSMNTIGWPKEIQWWYMEGRGIAQIDTLCLQQYACFLVGRSVADHCIHSAITAIRVPVHLPPASCLLWAVRERPTSLATFVLLF